MAQPNDIAKARTEAALLLRLDPSNLSPSDTLRCDLIASLRIVVDDASTSVLDGRAPDLARLLTATESLIRLLPSEPPQPANKQDDPRQHMWRTYLEMRRRGELGERAAEPSLRAQIDQLRAENESLRAASSTAVITPPTCDIVPPGERAECAKRDAEYRLDNEERHPPIDVDSLLHARRIPAARRVVDGSVESSVAASAAASPTLLCGSFCEYTGISMVNPYRVGIELTMANNHQERFSDGVGTRREGHP
jgi:hypothetical protein